MADNLNLSLYKNRTFPDVTFQLNGKEVKAHKAVLAERCEYFKQLFEQNRSNVINMDGTSLKLFEEVVKFCYLQQIDLSDWSYDDKESLHKLTTRYKYGPMMDFVKKELDKRPEVPLRVDTLNEWHKNSPGEELSEWIESNLLDIVNYEDCHKYSQDLILLILDTFNEMYDKENNKYELRTEEKQLLKWLFRWRNWCNRDEADVRNLFSKAKLQLVLKKQTLGDKVLQKKLSIETNDGLFLMPDSVAFTAKYETAIKHFLIFRKLDTNGWTCDEILQLLGCAHVYDFSPLIDAVLNVVATQYLEPASFAAIYDIAHQLESSKLEQVLVDYLRNNINSIFASAEFTNYPVRVVGFIFQNLSGPIMEVNTKRLIVTSIKKWMNSNGKEEVKKVPNFVQFTDFVVQLTTDIFSESFNDDHSKDLTFVFGKEEIKAHKWVLAKSCDIFKLLVDKDMNNRIKMEGIRIEPFNQLIKHCYWQKIDLTGWGYSEKTYLYDLATKYKCSSLMALVKCELDKRPKVPLGVESLNEWYGNCPDEEIREWVKNNLLNIVNYEDCHKYSNDLVVLIMDTFCELADKKTDKEKLETPLKKLILWLFRWRNSSTRTEDDLQSLFAKIRLPLVLKDRASMDKTLEKKLFEAVRRFCHIREVDTAGWTCDDVLELLYFAHDYEFGPLLDALVNAVATKYLKPATLEKIHHLTTRLRCNKLQQIMAHYIKNQTMVILTSAEFTSYPACLVEFILENLSGQGINVKVKNQLLTSLGNWKTSKSEDELKAVFTKIQWEDFSRRQLARVLRIVIPKTCLADISVPLAPAQGKRTKRKQGDNSENIKCGRPRKE